MLDILVGKLERGGDFFVVGRVARPGQLGESKYGMGIVHLPAPAGTNSDKELIKAQKLLEILNKNRVCSNPE